MCQVCIYIHDYFSINVYSYVYICTRMYIHIDAYKGKICVIHVAGVL